ncbi:sulfatase [Limibacter armeniacum]|uniref:sulfatase family protein n=1 Tax=Limibacter armeniacum TaxID=466084 RepID=UPI002FE59C9F
MKYFLTGWLVCAISFAMAQTSQPNVIIIFTDDQGYQDLGSYGSPNISTPNLDRMAKEGIRCTDFYVTASVCSPSRASLLTGRYPNRSSVGSVFFPDQQGMDSEQVTIAEILKEAGYVTACFGKWHLGDSQENLPLNQGFDEYFGIPYSNDMYIGSKQSFAQNVVFREGYSLEKAKADQRFVLENKKDRQKIKEKGLRGLCPLFEGNEIVEYPCEQTTLTERYFDRAMDFIGKQGPKPFFVYLTPAMPHVPLYASEKFEGRSIGGLYGDAVEEIDWNVGRLMQYLTDNRLDENTIVIFTSDNGPWLGYKDQAGHAAPLRDGKFTNYEGGVRVPCIMHWNRKWDADKSVGTILSTVDLLPTIAYYAGVELPKGQTDGINMARHLENTAHPLARNQVLYTKGKHVVGIRIGDWKLLPQSGARHSDETSKPELFNLKEDISESNNLYDKHPEIVRQLTIELEKFSETVK